MYTSRFTVGFGRTSLKGSNLCVNLTSKSRVSRSLYHTKNGVAAPAVEKHLTLTLLGLMTASSMVVCQDDQNNDLVSHNKTLCDSNYGRKNSSFDVVGLGKVTKEPATGILFPHLCNGMTFVGCGVRVKFGFIKIYAVGTYVDPIAMAAIKKQGDEAITKALLNPDYPRTIRIVMNRNLSIEKYTAAIVEALEPRMNGKELEKLDEFKKLNPPVDLIEGAEMEMTIRGDTMLYKNSVGGVGQIQSAMFCRALCDVYFGSDAVSPGHKIEVIKGVRGL